MRSEQTSDNASNATRTAILDATEAIMREEGYGAVSSRKIAAKAGLKSQLVHYYFNTMDDLFMALSQRVEERQFKALTRALASKEPLKAIWRMSIDATSPRLHKEITALATHRDSLRASIARSAERTRSIYAAVIARTLQERGYDLSQWSPEAISIILDGVARLIISESALGTTAGHADAVALIESWLVKLEPLERPLE